MYKFLFFFFFLLLVLKFLEKLFQKYPEKRQRYIVGQDVAGIVTELGESVSTFKVGDTVVGKCYLIQSYVDFNEKI